MAEPAPEPAPVPAIMASADTEEAEPPSPTTPAVPSVGPVLDSAEDGQNFHAVLWCRFEEVTARVKGGLDSTTALSKFVGKRIAAEAALAEVCHSMTMSGGTLSKFAGLQSPVIDSLKETGRVNGAWAMLMEQTLKTSFAHKNVETRLQAEVQAPMIDFLAAKGEEYSTLKVAGQIHNKALEDARAHMVKSRKQYCKACTSHQHSQLVRKTSQKLDETKLKMEEARTEYESSIRALNHNEKKVHEQLRKILGSLREIEISRLELLRTAMLDYVAITASELPAAIGEPIETELRPAIESIDAVTNVREFVEKGTKHWGLTAPGVHEWQEYLPLRDCPNEARSAASLLELGGGPVKTGNARI